MVLPITYATDPFAISEEERAENLDLADVRRGQVEDACNAIRRPDQTCRAVLAPILVRASDFRSTMLLGVVVGVYRRL